MSVELIVFSRRFVGGEISADDFADPYIMMWSAERDANILKNDPVNVSLCASSIFILADCFNPDLDRRGGELDEDGLRLEVKTTLEKHNLL